MHVSINYRVGPFGFPQGAEAATRGALNLGLKDQQAMFQWVQDNAVNFGGDPNNVTIVGLSAGAHSVSIGIRISTLYMTNNRQGWTSSYIVFSRK